MDIPEIIVRHRSREKLTREEMLNLVAKLKAGEGSDEDASGWLDDLAFSLGTPRIAELIFYSNEDLTPEEIIDRAQRYRPFEMPPPSTGAT